MYYVARDPGVVRLSSGYHTFEVVNGIVVDLERFPGVAAMLVASNQVIEMKGKPPREAFIVVSDHKSTREESISGAKKDIQ